jgi:hypothetical protein
MRDLQWATLESMAQFEVGDRVVVRGEPDRCGTVKEIREDTAGYLISWDDNVVGERGEDELMPCPGSHTAQR